MKRNLLSIRHSVAEVLVSFGLAATLLFTPAASVASFYGTFDNYVHQALGITDEQLEQIRENLLKGWSQTTPASQEIW